ncbi:MAG: hypothetical protein K2J80_01785 [Oscillospiraceae bacterium]|nr:hypothetical protein [Oscillospiraceae bacterium]
MSWSAMKKRLEEEFLAEKLRGRIKYHCPGCGECSDEEALVRFDGRELLLGEYFVYDRCAVIDLTRAIYRSGDLTRLEVLSKAMISALEKGVLDSQIVLFTAHRFINSPIEASLYGENPLARMYAVLDRRTGKRRLKQLVGRINEEPEWLQQFCLIRLQAEGINAGK